MFDDVVASAMKDLEIAKYWKLVRVANDELSSEYLGDERLMRDACVREFRTTLDEIFESFEKWAVCDQVVPYHSYVSQKLSELKNAIDHRVALYVNNTLPDPCYFKVENWDIKRFKQQLERNVSVILELRRYAEQLQRPRTSSEVFVSDENAQQIRQFAVSTEHWTARDLALKCLEIANGEEPVFLDMFDYACNEFITNEWLSKFFPVDDEQTLQNRQLAQVKVRVFITSSDLYPKKFAEKTLAYLRDNRNGWPYAKAMDIFESLQFEINPLTMIKKFLEATTLIQDVITELVGVGKFTKDSYFEVLLTCFAASRIVGRMRFLDYMIEFAKEPIGSLDYEYHCRTFQTLKDILTSEKDVAKLFQGSV